MYRRVLIATDGSEAAARAATHAVALARRCDATLHALSVVETRTAYDNAIVDPEVVRENLRAESEAAVAAVSRRAESANVPVEATVEAGVPHEVIVDYVDREAIDLVVLGAKGKSAFKTALLGSVTEAVLRSGTAPVLVVDGA
ncbi:universal stress protein [Halomarina pelagica]|uniref:universal stress protein n=1 Tax=Halomarina pelagica TaxID=2961599 RepID=UPI0020C4CA3E|nr:universal stress protein [Halomarina sp. BND7]